MNSLKGHTGDVYAVSIYRDKIVSAGHDKSIRVWNSLTGALIYKIDYAHSHVIRALDIYSGPATEFPCIISGSWDTTCKVFNLLTGKTVYTLAGHTNRVKCVYAVSMHEAHESPFCYSGADDGTIICWNIALGVSQYVLNGHSRHILALDACITPILKVHHTTPFPLSFSENGFVSDLQAIDSNHISELDQINHMSILASGSSDRTIIIWEMKSGKQIRTIDSHNREVVSLVFTFISDPSSHSNRGCRLIRYLCSGNAIGDILVHNIDNGMLIYSLEGHTASVSNLSLSCRNCLERSTAKNQITSKFPYLLSVCNEGIIYCWDLETGKEDKIIGKVTSKGELVDRNSPLQGCILHSINIEIIYRTIEKKNISTKTLSKNPLSKVIQSERPPSRPGSMERLAGEIIVISGDDSLLFMISMEKILITSVQVYPTAISSRNRSNLDKMLSEVASQSSDPKSKLINSIVNNDEISIITVDTQLRQVPQLTIADSNHKSKNLKNKNSLYRLDQKNNSMSKLFNAKSSSKLVSNITNDINNANNLNKGNIDLNNRITVNNTSLDDYFKLKDNTKNIENSISISINSPNGFEKHRQDSPSSLGKTVDNFLSNLPQPEPSPFTKYMNDNEIVRNTSSRGSQRDISPLKHNMNGLTNSTILSTIHNNNHESYYRSSHTFDKSKNTNSISQNSNNEIDHISKFGFSLPNPKQIDQLNQQGVNSPKKFKLNSNIHHSNQIVNKINKNNNFCKTNVINFDQHLSYSESMNNLKKNPNQINNSLQAKIISSGFDIPNLLTRKYYNHNRLQQKGNISNKASSSFNGGLTGNSYIK